MVAEKDTLGDEVSRWTRELRKGSTRIALLSILDKGESYGYEILATLRDSGTGALAATEAAVYPLLKDMEANHILQSQWRTTEEGVPPRKYYSLTATGVELLAKLKDAWRTYRNEMDDIIGGKQ